MASYTCDGCGINIRDRVPGVKCKGGVGHKWIKQGDSTPRKSKHAVAATPGVERQLSEEAIKARKERNAEALARARASVKRDWPEDDPYNRNIYNSCAWGVHSVLAQSSTGALFCVDCKAEF